MTNYRQLIQNELVKLCKAGKFYAVNYKEGVAELVLPGETPEIAPKTCLANETGCAFTKDRNMGRKQQRTRDRWTFQVILGFPREVSVENFENALLADPPIIPQNHAGYVNQQITLNLDTATYSHPPQSSPSNGSSVTLDFEAVIGRT